MARSDQSDSDPLPFVQVHRSAKAGAAQLADHLSRRTGEKISFQHALGALVAFWESVGDPRELERIVRKGGDLAVVLAADELELKFELACGYRVEAKVLAALRFAEERPDGFRVRGMSRQLETVEERVIKRDAGAKGGKASVESRRRHLGSAQPRAVEKPVESAETAKSERSAPASGRAQPSGEAAPNHQPKHDRSSAEPPTEAAPMPEVIGERSEERRGSMSSPLEPDRAGRVEDKKTWGLQAHNFVQWARAQAPELGDPGPAVFRWALSFFEKYQPADVELPRVAFASFLLWCHQAGKTPGWGLWLTETIWEPRWATARANAQARGAA